MTLVPIVINTLLCIFSLKTSNYGIFPLYPLLKLKIPSKDIANPLSHQVIPSLNLFSSTQAVAPVGNNTKKHIITVVQFQEKNQKPLKAKPSKTRRTKKTENRNIPNGKE